MKRLAAVAVWGWLASASAAEITLRMSSDPGDFVGAGAEYGYTSVDGTFEVESQSPDVASIRFFGASGDWWLLTFAAAGGAPLSTGLYPDAMRHPFQDPDRPGLSVAGNQRGCNTLVGAFQIKEIAFAPEGRIDTLVVRFEQHCEGLPPSLQGEFRFHARSTVAVRAPFRRPVERTRTVSFGVSAEHADDQSVSLSADRLPPGASFVDHGNSTGTFSWTPSFDRRGPYDVVFRGTDRSGAFDESTTSITVRGTTSLLLEREPLGELGGGLVRFFDASEDFYVLRGSAGTATVMFNTPRYEHHWHLAFASADGAPLAVGTYAGATRYPFQVPGSAGLSVSGDGWGCNHLTGSFEIKEIVYRAPDEISSLWATFEQFCEGRPPALRGEVRVDADVPVRLATPSNPAAREGRELALELSAFSEDPGVVAFSAAGLPPGAGLTDRHDGTAVLRWTPLHEQIGEHVVRVTAENDLGESDTLPVPVLVRMRNDDFDDAIEIPGLPFDDVRDTSLATSGADDPTGCAGSGPTAWYAFTPGVDTAVEASAAGSDHDVGISVYAGPRGALEPLGCRATAMRFVARAGRTYHVMARSLDDGGVLRFRLAAAPPPPANDAFERAVVVDAFPLAVTLDTTWASTAPDDPYACSERYRSVWYKVPLRQNGLVTVSTAGSTYSGSITVLEGRRGALAAVACGGSSVSFEGSTGRTYYVMIVAAAGATGGRLNLAISLAARFDISAGLDPFARLDPATGAITLTGRVTCSTANSIVLFGEVHQDDGASPAVDAWFEVTVPCHARGGWTATVLPEGGRFGAGAAAAKVHGVGVHGPSGDVAECFLEHSLRIGRGRPGNR